MRVHLYSRTVDESDFLERVKREVASLPHAEREILALVSAERLTYRQISGRLSVSEETLKKRIVGVREGLRTRLFHEPIEPDRAEFLETPNRSG
jgi:DNA-directed RNA polymerase specialized sigma24 family protein